MAKKRNGQDAKKTDMDLTPLVAASLAGIVYQARLFNRQARMNVREESVISEVVTLWRTVKDAMGREAESSKADGEPRVALPGNGQSAAP